MPVITSTLLRRSVAPSLARSALSTAIRAPMMPHQRHSRQPVVMASIHQGALNRVQKKELRSRAQQGSIVTVQIGKNGVTENTLTDVFNALYKNELIKIKLGGGCEEELDDVIEAITKGCDCALVHSIGFTAILYRERGLPRIVPSLEGAAGQEEEDEEEEDEEVEITERRQSAAAAAASAPAAKMEGDQEKAQGAKEALAKEEGDVEEGEEEEQEEEEDSEEAQLLGDEEDDDFIDAEDLVYFKLDEEDPRAELLKKRLEKARQTGKGPSMKKPPVFEVVKPAPSLVKKI